MKKSITVIILIAIFAVTGISAQHGPQGFGRGAGMGHQPGNFHKKSQNPFRFKSLDRIYDKRNQLNLSDEQVVKIKELIYQFRTAQADRKADLEKARINLQHLKSDKSSPADSVMDTIDQLFRLQAETAKANYRFRTELRSIFSEEQLKKFEKLQKSRRSNSHRFLPEIERQLIFDDELDSQ